MRNIKRILAMSLATVMLCASMVVGSAASFNDADKIVNTEAATITAGLGLFAGTTDGNFDPQGTVTRAQMAAVVAKMFYGSDLNADTYKGGNQFTDTVDFEGGWAEGYINLGVEKGWFAGYGDGTFKPGAAVTTAEAVTMLINLLGVDAGAGTWPMTVMAAAEDIELFDLVCELKPAPATNVTLTRDQLAVMVWNALNYSADSDNIYAVGKMKFESFSDALAYSTMTGESIAFITGKDTLATTTFELLSYTGYITDNQTTTDNEYTTVDGKDFAIDTTLADIGHYVTVYYAEEYKNERDPGVTYCIYDAAEYITVDEEIESARDYKKVFGTSINTNGKVTVTNGNYVVDTDTVDNVYTNGKDTAVVGTYVVYEDNMIGYIEPTNVTVTKVTGVITTPGKEYIITNAFTAQNNEDIDNIVEYAGIAKNDIVLVQTIVRDDNTKYIVTKADKVTGKVEKIANKDGDVFVTVDGNVYVAHENAGIEGILGSTIDSASFNFDAIYDFYVCGDTYFGYATSESTANMNDIIYVVDCYDTTTAGAYGTDVTKYFAQGVNMSGEEVNVLIGANGYGKTSIEDGFYTFKKATTKNESKEGIMVETAVNVTGETYDILRGSVTTAFDKDEMTVKVNMDDDNAKNDDIYFINDDTKFIYVKDTTKTELEVSVFTGNMSLKKGDYPILYTTDKRDNKTIEVVVIVAEDIKINVEDFIYVSADQIANVSQTADGLSYEVYFADANEIAEILVTTEIKEDEYGFYEYTYDEEDNKYTLTDTDAAKFNDVLLKNVTIDNIMGDYLVIGNKTYDASAAIINDARGEDAIEDSIIPEITNFDELAAAFDVYGIEITISTILDEESDILNIYIVDINE